jgi:O-acetyl-ADP-ribose deacetylase (regulator of RNase III)
MNLKGQLMLHVTHGNIFNELVDAIVNPANVSLLAGIGLYGEYINSRELSL